MRRRSEKYVANGSKYAYGIWLYLSFHLSWVLGPSVHGRLQNLKASEDTFGHDITPLTSSFSRHLNKTGVRGTGLSPMWKICTLTVDCKHSFRCRFEDISTSHHMAFFGSRSRVSQFLFICCFCCGLLVMVRVQPKLR